MDSERKSDTMQNYAFNKSTGSRHNEVKSHMLSQFENEGMQGAFLESQAEKMNKFFHCLCFLINHTDGHAEKIHRADGFSLLKNVEVLAGESESAATFKKLNNK